MKRPAVFLIAACFILSGCGTEKKSAGTKRKTAETIRLPSADGTDAYTSDNGQVTLDISHTDNGYLMVRDTGSHDVQIQITNPDGEVYPYPLKLGEFEAFPLTKGDGSYKIQVFEEVSGQNYAIALSENFTVTLQDEFQPFLYPSQYVNYTDDSEAVKLGRKLSDKSADDLDYVQNVYDYIINGIAYDDELAENTPTNYIPDIDKTLQEGKGICFDYAALMSAMLRSQNIPTRLEVGYSGDVYHAWISVYLDEIGWVDNIISFDGSEWTIMDPTLGAANDPKDVKKYVGDASNYQVKYIY